MRSFTSNVPIGSDTSTSISSSTLISSILPWMTSIRSPKPSNQSQHQDTDSVPWEQACGDLQQVNLCIESTLQKRTTSQPQIPQSNMSFSVGLVQLRQGQHHACLQKTHHHRRQSPHLCLCCAEMLTPNIATNDC